MKRKIKNRTGMICIVIILVGLMVAPSFAADNNISYKFKIKANNQNSYSYDEFRQTYNMENKWKIDLRYSGEGDGTISTFWLAKSSNFQRVSGVFNVKEGSGAHYYRASSLASNHTYVSFGAENNNTTTKTYTISGYWDEETN